MGVRFIVVTNAARVSHVIAAFNAADESAFVIGKLTSAEGPEPIVRYTGSLRGA